MHLLPLPYAAELTSSFLCILFTCSTSSSRCSAVGALLGFIWYNNRRHTQRFNALRRRYILMSRSKGRPCHTDEAEQLAIRHAKSHTPSKAVQARLLKAAANHTLYICAGLGTSGTSALERALVKLGLVTAKWGHVVTQPRGVTETSSIMDALCAPPRRHRQHIRRTPTPQTTLPVTAPAGCARRPHFSRSSTRSTRK